MRDLLTESGSIFVQIGDENVHRVRAVMDEVFGAENFVAQIAFTKTTGGLDSRATLPTLLTTFFGMREDSEQREISGRCIDEDQRSGEVRRTIR